VTTARTRKAPPPPARERIRRWFRDATLKQWLKRFVLAGLVGAILVLLGVLWAYSAVSLPAEPEQARTTIMYDSAGNTLDELYKEQNRVSVPLDKVADIMEKAVVSAEDRHFYEHSGIDPIGITRALFNDVRGRNVQGGSTITQQLVKNTYLTSERSLTRKAKEAILAVKVERSLGKREILERYLNTIYFGRGAYGIEKAAENYFGKSAAELQLPEAALLAGLIRAPESADPQTAPAAARNRRAIVLNALQRDKVITKAEAAAAKAAPLPDKPRPDPAAGLTGSTAYFVTMVRSWALDQFGERIALGGGLRIKTTLDPKMQAEAEEAIKGVLDRPDDPDAALVTMDDEGAVRAMIGGKDFRASQVNLAISPENKAPRPQAGSTFKPIDLASALEHDIPVTQRYSGPNKLNLEFDGYAPVGKPWTNYGRESFGSIDLTEATVHSVNTSYIQLAKDVGLKNIIETGHELGIESDIPDVPSMALGSANVSPYEMVRAYMTFANRGERVDPYFVKEVTDSDGTVLWTPAKHKKRVLDEKYADVVNAVLQQVIKRGTGTAAAIGRPAAGKTGTTTNNSDAWFVGYTPKLGTAIWMGYKEGNGRPMDDVHGREATGGTFPAQIWSRYMKQATADMDTGDFTPPDKDLMNAKPDGSESTTTSSTETTTSTIPDESTTTTSEPTDESTTTTIFDPDASTTTTSTPPSTTTTTRPRTGGATTSVP
jgi:penicillin-binding protein 1A